MYDHIRVEKEVREFWEKNGIYEKVKEKTKDGEPFYFVDGPPYVTGEIHPGTAWNKSIKDMMIRYYRMMGFNVRSQPGFDTHGLPIEVKVEKLLEIKNKEEIEQRIGIERFIAECKKFADKYIAIMTEQFKSVGVWMDWDRPYITYKDDYIEKSWQTLKQAWEKGLMHEGYYVLPYCYRCQTTLANYELEYGEERDPSIYVKFKVKGKDKEYLIIWTTTPWTLVANMAVMAHPEFEYVRAKVDDETWIFAKERVEHLQEKTGKSIIILESFPGKELEGLRYEHPFQDVINKEYDRRVVLSEEYVTLEEGTGLVHTAPGHGPEDFEVGKKYGIEIFCPVDEKGNYTSEAGRLAGKNVREANPEIIEILRERNALVHEERITHRYPHCWRCKTPLIYITTKQWFINITKLKEKMKERAKTVFWVPKFGKERFLQFVENAPDWCISRQRYWGIPLPIWRCKKCGKVKVIGSKEELGREVKELHRPYVDKVKLRCECGGEMERVKDVLDVWFDSGNAVWAELNEEEKKIWGERADLIIEGHDQIRGWYYSLLGSGLIKYDDVPYKRLMMHGFFVDEKGEKMSKSLGNFVPLSEILEKYGADAFRFWSLSNTIWEDLKFQWEEIKEGKADLNILYNLVTYLERSYFEGDGEEKVEDKWLVSRMNSVLKKYHEAFSILQPNLAVREVREFLVNDLSRFYMKLAKERIKNGDGRAARQVYEAVLLILKLLAPVVPFITEHSYQRFFRKYEGEESIHLFALPRADDNKVDVELEEAMRLADEIIAKILQLRQEAGVKRRWPLKRAAFLPKDEEMKEKIERVKDVIQRMINAKSFVIGEKLEKAMETPFGEVSIDPTVDEEIYEEGMAREIIRRIQLLRKEKGLVEKEGAVVKIDGEKEILGIIERRKGEIEEATKSKITIGVFPEEGREWVIDGKRVEIYLEKEN